MSTSESKHARQYSTELQIAASRQQVWEAIATEVGLRRWFPPEAQLDGRPGGRVVWKWGEAATWTQVIEVWEPGQRLRTRYESAVLDADGTKHPLFVDFQLSGEGGSTTLRLVQSGFGPDAAFDEEYDGISRGWPVELQSLKLSLERHAGKDRHVVFLIGAVTIEPAEAWRRLTGDEGFRCGAELDQLKPGAAFSFETADGDRFEGQALRCNPLEFTGVVKSHGDGFLRFGIEKCGSWQAWLWLATYDGPAPVQGLEERWGKLLERLSLATPSTAASKA